MRINFYNDDLLLFASGSDKTGEIVAFVHLYHNSILDTLCAGGKLSRVSKACVRNDTI